jgi:hypothetical protein
MSFTFRHLAANDQSSIIHHPSSIIQKPYRLTSSSSLLQKILSSFNLLDGSNHINASTITSTNNQQESNS